jgi:hypothetical protein
MKFLGQDGLHIDSIIPTPERDVFPKWTEKQRWEFAAFVARHGQPYPLILDEVVFVVDGYQRLSVLREMGETEIDVLFYRYDSDLERDNHALLLNSVPAFRGVK